MSSQMKMIMTMMNAGGQMTSKDYHVEINPSHELIVNLNILRKEDPKVASLTIKQAYDTTLIQSGIPLQNTDFSKRTFIRITNYRKVANKPTIRIIRPKKFYSNRPTNGIINKNIQLQ